MNPQEAGIMETLLRAYQQGRHLLLLFDYDGTLTPLVAHPRLARLSPLMRRILKRLATTPQVVVGILSGRTLEDLKSMVGLKGLYYAGTVGMELDLRGKRIRHPQAKQMTLLISQIAGRLATILPRFPGAWLENKKLGLTVHYRQMDPVLQPAFQAHIGKALQADREQLHLEEGPLSLEITPQQGWSKADAVHHIIGHLGAAQVFPFFAGDAANDISALEAVETYDGLGLWIGPKLPSFASFHLTDPHELLEALIRLHRELSRVKRIRVSPGRRAAALYGLRINFSPQHPK